MCADQAEFLRAFNECLGCGRYEQLACPPACAKPRSEPVLQNIPIRTETGRVLRNAFSRNTPLVHVDFASLEARVLAEVGHSGRSKP